MILVKMVCAVFLGLGAAYFIFSAFKYTRMISNIFLSLVYTPALENILSSRGEKVMILDTGDQEIEGLLLEKKDSKKIIIFCHESGSTKESWEKYAYFLPDLGFSVLSVDLAKNSPTPDRKNALSQWPTSGDVERLLTVIRWARKALNREARIILFGVSHGADIALAASFLDPSVSAVIADGLFSMKEIFRDYIRKWAPILVKPNFFGENYPDWVVNIFSDLGFWFCQRKSHTRFVNVEKLLKKKHVPVLMIHGEKDDYVPESHQRFLHRLSSKEDKARHLVVPDAKHNQAVILGPDEYEKSIVEFIGWIE